MCFEPYLYCTLLYCNLLSQNYYHDSTGLKPRLQNFYAIDIEHVLVIIGEFGKVIGSNSKKQISPIHHTLRHFDPFQFRKKSHLMMFLRYKKYQISTICWSLIRIPLQGPIFQANNSMDSSWVCTTNKQVPVMPMSNHTYRSSSPLYERLSQNIEGLYNYNWRDL